MAIFFASDLHFGHAKLMEYYPEHRGTYKTVDQVDEAIIINWNNAIDDEDTVFVLGDLGAPLKYLDACLWQLKGEKILVTGNHDRKIWRDVSKHFVEVHQYYHAEWIGDKYVTMCHYPIWEWDAIHRGSYHLHGHLHGRPHGIPGRILDVGIDGHNLKPWAFTDIIRHMESLPVRKHNDR